MVFFKQKTAYDIWYGLVGSEMCIRDRAVVVSGVVAVVGLGATGDFSIAAELEAYGDGYDCRASVLATGAVEPTAGATGFAGQ